MIKNSQRRKEKREAAKWLLSLIGEDWGIRVLPAGADKPRPVHANTNVKFEAVISSRRAQPKSAVVMPGLAELAFQGDMAVEEAPASHLWLDRLSQRLIMRHFDNAPREFRIDSEIIVKPETVYFTGRRSRRNEICLTLLMIDIDAHKVGGPKEAMQFADHLRDAHFPGLYVETSTNGNGAHPFLIVDKTDWADADYNTVLKELDHWLKGVLAATGIELDTVEIKGHCATVRWIDGMPKHKMGTLAKLPREWERFDELKQSPVYTPHQLLAMIGANPVLAVAKDSPVAEDRAKKVQKMRREGSVPFQGVEPERIDLWVDYARRLLNADVHVGKSADNRLVVTSEDVGITCALLEFVGKKMNEDGTLPWKRTKGLWDCLYERGVISRSFNSKRFAWIRRFLNGAGLVDVQDPTYVVGERAAKWSPSPRFWEISASLNIKGGEEEQDLTETGSAIDPHECWEKGIPLVRAGFVTMEKAERRRMEELVEAIICPAGWNLAA